MLHRQPARRQQRKFLGRKNAPPRKQAAGNKEPGVRNHPPSKARHAGDYIPGEAGVRIGIRLPAECRREEQRTLISALRLLEPFPRPGFPAASVAEPQMARVQALTVVEPCAAPQLVISLVTVATVLVEVLPVSRRAMPVSDPQPS